MGTKAETRKTRRPRAPRGRRQEGTSKRRTQDERTADTTQRLIQATIALVCERGYANTTTAEIAARAKVSRGALQHHFRSRSDLIIAVAEHLTKNMLRLGEKISAEQPSLEECIESAVDHYMATYLHQEYLATLHILIGIINDSGFTHQARLVEIQKGSDGPWLSLFAGQGIDEQHLLAARRLTLSALRGMAVAKFLGITTVIEPELKLLKSMLLRFFHDCQGIKKMPYKAESSIAHRPAKRRRAS